MITKRDIARLPAKQRDVLGEICTLNLSDGPPRYGALADTPALCGEQPLKAWIGDTPSVPSEGEVCTLCLAHRVENLVRNLGRLGDP